ncbi:MAG TPA: class I SAM-dependent methyltransferase [Telluria sp.]
MSKQAEQDRINEVYRQWHGAGQRRDAWHRQDMLLREADRARALAALLPVTVGSDLSAMRAIDVGCGHGDFVRQLIAWGANPACLAGTELQPDRLEHARLHTAPGVRWHLGTLDVFPDNSADLVSASTVFSTILDDDLRRALAGDMWRVLRPGGWALIFDLRYNSARNRSIRKVTDVELLRFWPAEQRHYRTLVLAPPLARALARLPRLLPELLASLLPPLRSHFFYMAQKEPA